MLLVSGSVRPLGAESLQGHDLHMTLALLGVKTWSAAALLHPQQLAAEDHGCAARGQHCMPAGLLSLRSVARQMHVFWASGC